MRGHLVNSLPLKRFLSGLCIAILVGCGDAGGGGYAGSDTAPVAAAADGPPDSDLDGVQDSTDACPETQRASPVNALGCSAAQLATELEHGLYAFEPEQRTMQAEKKPGYRVTVTLFTAASEARGLTVEPTLGQFLSNQGRLPEEVSRKLDAIVRDGVQTRIGRWAEDMEVKLSPLDPATATITSAMAGRQTILRPKNVWSWRVTPHCVREAFYEITNCKPLVLEASAVAYLGESEKKLSYLLFENEEIGLTITTGTALGLLWEEYFELILSAVLLPLIGFFGSRMWSRRNSADG